MKYKLTLETWCASAALAVVYMIPAGIIYLCGAHQVALLGVLLSVSADRLRLAWRVAELEEQVTP